MPSDRVVVPVSRSEALELLNVAHVGRVILTDAALPTALPVAYTMVGDDVVFRSGPGMKLEAAGGGTVVAFQVDDFDESLRLGWSVVATGKATVVTDPTQVESLERLVGRPWVESGETRFVRIAVGPVSGRRVRPAPLPPAT